MAFRWTEERVERLIELWNKGESLSVLGKALGCSRSAATGKIKRLRDAGDERIKRELDAARAHRLNSAKREPSQSYIKVQKKREQFSLYILQRHECDGVRFRDIARELGTDTDKVRYEYRRIIAALESSEAA